MSEMFVRRSFSEFAELQAGLQTLRVDGVATEPEAFCGSIAAVHFPEFSVEIVRTGPALLFGGAERDRAGYLLLLDDTEGAKLDGCHVDKRDVACLRPDTAIAASFAVPIAFAFLSTEAGAEAEVLGCPEAQGRKSARATPLQRAGSAAHERLANTIRAA